jgi:hypothetical protein
VAIVMTYHDPRVAKDRELLQARLRATLLADH